MLLCQLPRLSHYSKDTQVTGRRYTAGCSLLPTAAAATMQGSWCLLQALSAFTNTLLGPLTMVVMQLHVCEPFCHDHSRHGLVEHSQPGQHLTLISKGVHASTLTMPAAGVQDSTSSVLMLLAQHDTCAQSIQNLTRQGHFKDDSWASMGFDCSLGRPAT